MVTTQRHAHVLANKLQLANVAVYSYNDIQHYDISMYKTLYTGCPKKNQKLLKMIYC